VKPRNTIPPFITKITSITNEDVATAESFPAVRDAFIRFMQQHANEYEDNEEVPPVENTLLVGHNKKVFNIPFRIHQLNEEHGIADRLFQDGRFSLGIDTLNVARKGIRSNKSGIGVPLAYNLPTLYQFVTGLLPSTWHCAMADVKATATIYSAFLFFGTQDTNMFLISQKENRKFMLPQGRLK
jgi:DNA polymerase III epsilon subunit-like protein